MLFWLLLHLTTCDYICIITHGNIFKHVVITSCDYIHVYIYNNKYKYVILIIFQDVNEVAEGIRDQIISQDNDVYSRGMYAGNFVLLFCIFFRIHFFAYFYCIFCVVFFIHCFLFSFLCFLFFIFLLFIMFTLTFFFSFFFLPQQMWLNIMLLTNQWKIDIRTIRKINTLKKSKHKK